ncbi:uncharacterized protein G2W53_028146 [Senna tora]|uniref:Uncharacterized protein n=1 Tax=Senna tora TaxID=362788 RepID=A0A834W9H9_9FABA|nr:uncharacterized protein G2W53_028146 [Senna tora]
MVPDFLDNAKLLEPHSPSNMTIHT